jgi:rhamnose transport system ATP-binding protein
LPALLQLSNIEKSFGAVRALRGVSFDLHAGEVHALLGENGAGKSTLIKVMTGAHRADRGTMMMGGKLIDQLTPRRASELGIACIYQQPSLFPDLSVAENIGLRLEKASSLRRVDWPKRRSRAAELLGEIGATIDPEKEVRDLSMPEQQLVEIACALGAGAQIVIMDEPTASLTRKEQERLFSVVRGLRSRGVGVIYISHRLEEIFALADRVTVLRDGESLGSELVGVHNEAALIERMVGRKVSGVYPMASRSPGPVVMGLRDLGCRVGGVKAVTLEVRAGEIFGLAGLVGAGRTELARMLFGLTPADFGEIELRGKRVTISSPQAAVGMGIGYLPEDRRRHGVILEMGIAANLTMAIHPQIFPWGWLHFLAEKMLGLKYIKELGIKAFGPEAQGNSLSGGNQQKVALGRWLATAPQVLILDEPTQGVDVGAKGEIHLIIRRLAEEGLAVLLISSDLPEVLGMSDRIGVMRGGRLVTTFHRKAMAGEVMAVALGHAEGGEG